jgi:ribosomal RNA-processing protein 12
MVDSNVELIDATEEELNVPTSSPIQYQTKENSEFLRTQVKRWLAVLFDVYGSVSRDSHRLIGEDTTAWASIARPEETHGAFLQVVHLLKTKLPMVQQGTATAAAARNDFGNMTTTSQDILLSVLPPLSRRLIRRRRLRFGSMPRCLAVRTIVCRGGGIRFCQGL